ncbi:MAG: transporter substrate-binding domain-containing protein, partial [Oscillospiraceae bacterium]
SDLEGKVVGIQKGSSAVSALEKDEIHDKIKTLTEFKENVSALNDLKTGRLDAVVVDEVVGKYYVAKDAASFKILDETLAEEEYGIGVKKGNTELLNKLQAALDEIYKDGTVSKISEKWFGDDIVMK